VKDESEIPSSCRRCSSQHHCLPKNHACPARLHSVTGGRQGEASGRGLHSAKLGIRVQAEIRQQARREHAQAIHDAFVAPSIVKPFSDKKCAPIDVMKGFK